jgi:hypothetical protein
MRQFEGLRKCIKDTKASYELTYQTMQGSERVLKEVTVSTSTSRKEKFQTPSRPRFIEPDVPGSSVNVAVKRQDGVQE